jgi:hypothetical protein
VTAGKKFTAVRKPERYRPARLDLHKSGTIGSALKRTSTGMSMKTKIKNRKPIAVDDFFSADPIWPDGTFKPIGKF